MTSVSYAPRAAMRVRERAALRHSELFGVLALAAVLNLWKLSVNGWANTYYSAAVRAMSASWHDFLFASMDKSGLMTVDKTPLAFWVQALSARVFGFRPLSILVPEALMGVGAVALVYDMTRRRFGRAAGFAAGLAFALTPITVAVARYNNPDELLILCWVAALWCALRALESGRTKWLVRSGVCVGLGFETKMGVALLVVPGIAVAYLWAAPAVGGWLRALRQLLAGGATFGGAGGGPGGTLFGGATGPFRLLQSGLGDQAGWLLGFAAVAGVAILALARGRRRDRRTGWMVAVGGALLVSAVVFSSAEGIFHPYYVSFLAPFAAALVGGGFGLLADHLAARVIAPLLLAGGIVTELVVLRGLGGALSWATPLVLVVAGVAAVVLLLRLRARPCRHRRAGPRHPARGPGGLGGRDARARRQRHLPGRRTGERRVRWRRRRSGPRLPRSGPDLGRCRPGRRRSRRLRRSLQR